MELTKEIFGVSHLNTNFVDNNKQICYFIRDRLMMQE